MKFVDLLRDELGPAKQHRFASDAFARAVEQSSLVPFGFFGGEPPTHRIVVGLAPYARPELAWADSLSNIAASVPDLRIEVFNVLECTEMSDFDRYIPSIGRVLQTPVIGIWSDGVLKESGTGYSGRVAVNSFLRSLGDGGSQIETYRAG